jgi:thioredoxin-related protein
MSRLPLDRQASGNFHAVERFKSDLLRARREKPIIEPVRTIVTLLHAQQHPVVTRKDATDYTETEIETYSTEELGQLFGACTAAERLTFQFFLGTGCREREVMFA